MKYNIWYVSKYTNISPYGADTRQSNLCNEFSKAGNKVRLITSNSSHLYDTLPEFNSRYKDMLYKKFNVTWINTIKYKKPYSFIRFIGWIFFEFFVCSMSFKRRYEKPQIIVVSSLSILSVISGCFYKFFYKSKFIFEVRDIWPQTLIDLKGFSAYNPFILFLSLIERIGYKYCDSIVGTMPGLKEHVLNKIGNSSKVKIIPQGVNLDFYKNNTDKVSEDFINLYVPKNKFIVSYAGTMGYSNALEYVIEAAKIFSRENIQDIHFLFIGEGYLKEQLQIQAKGLSNVSFVPAVKKTQLNSILTLSNLLVASVRNEEIYKYGISLNKLIDYMYSKKPIICMMSGYPSIINDANCGEFTPSENPKLFTEAIKKYKNMSHDELDEIGKNGYQFLVERLSFEILASDFMKLFDDKP